MGEDTADLLKKAYETVSRTLFLLSCHPRPQSMPLISAQKILTLKSQGCGKVMLYISVDMIHDRGQPTTLCTILARLKPVSHRMKKSNTS